MVDDGIEAEAVLPARGKVGDLDVVVPARDLLAPEEERVLGGLGVALELYLLHLVAHNQLPHEPQRQHRVPVGNVLWRDVLQAHLVLLQKLERETNVLDLKRKKKKEWFEN